MKNWRSHLAPLLAAFVIIFAASTAQAAAKFEVIPVNDLATSLTVKLQWTWHAIGIDPSDNVYVVFGGPDGDSADCALFQHQARTGKTRLVGLLSDAAKEAGTWREGERIEKGHTPLPWINGKIYIGTMPFHDASSKNPKSMELAKKSHGAHIMAYDPKTDKIEDVCRNEPDGVFFPQRGFMCLTAIPDTTMLAAMTVPHGDILVYDTATGTRKATVPYVTEEFGRHVTREIVPAPNGKIYYQYGSENWDKEPGHMYSYDMNTGERSGPIDCDPYLWNGLVRRTSDQAMFMITQQGYLYQLHPENDSVERIGSVFPESDRRKVEEGEYLFDEPHVMGMQLSMDEKSIYTIPLRVRARKADVDAADGKKTGGAQVPLGLYRFDLSTRTAERVSDVPKTVGLGYIAGTDIRDSQGNFYFTHHGGNYLGLVKVTIEE